MIRKVPSMESQWNSLISSWITSLPILDLRSRMSCVIPSIESNWNSLLSSSTESLSFQDPCVDNDLDNPGDQTWVEFTSLFSNESIFSRSVVDNDQDKLIDRKWVKFTSLSSTKYMYFLDPLSRWFGQSCQLKVSEIHLSLSSTKYASFLDRRLTMISTMLPINSNWNWLLSSSTDFVFGRSTVDNFSDTAAGRKVSEIDLTFTIWISVFSRSMGRQCFWNSRRSKVSGIQFSSPVLHRCLFYIHVPECFGQCR